MANRIHATLTIVFLAVLAWAPNVHAAQESSINAPQDCAAPGSNTIVLAAPKRYADELKSKITAQRCIVITFGSDYQVLDWLENGKVDAAIVSPFALKLIELEAGERFGEQYRVSDRSPFADAKLAAATYALRYWNGEEWEAGPRDRYVANLEATGDRGVIPIHVPSHLSPGLMVLLEYTTRWTGNDPRGGSSATWKRFVAALRFSVEPGQRNRSASARPRFEVVALDGEGGASCREPELVCMGEEALRDHFIAHTYVGWPADATSTAERTDAGSLAWLDRFHDEQQLEELDDSLRAFYLENYQQHSVDFRKRRYFRFTLDELWKLLAAHDAGARENELALVLTGGGVKAAYQTELVDYLYRRGYLRNALAAGQEQSARTQRVDYVIGTSGGALLGLVVAVLDGPMATGLSDLVWKTGDDYLDSTDVFPFIEMPRYASVIYAGVIFALICGLLLASARIRSLLLPGTSAASTSGAAQGGGDITFTVVWIVLLGVSPWVIKWVMGEAALEHVPVIAGIFYTLYIYIAVYSDNRLNTGGPSREDRASMPLVFPLLFGIGAVMALVPIFADSEPSWLQRQHELGFLGTISAATLICCTGFLVLALTYHRYRYRAGGAEPSPIRPLICAAAILIGFPIVAYLLIWAAGVSLFELKPDLWLWYGLTAAVLTLVLLVLARYERVPVAIRKPLSDGFDFLFERHPRRTLFARARRYSRAIFFLALAWVWWNLVNAPAIYGNEQAQRHFAQILQRFEQVAGAENMAFKAPFIISATSLDKEREVYFMVDPDRCDPRTAAVAPTPNWLTITTDPRWIELSPELRRIDEESELTELGKVAFASGSPFPVFPMTRIGPLPLKEGCGDKATSAFDPDSEPAGEWLVDGGFAHNIPVNAASQVGARRILVISSSPLHRLGETSRPGISTYTIGRLILGIPRLFPYLWQRSQIEDALSTEDMLVVALSPSLDQDESWPLLVDFQARVIREVIAKAEDNLEGEHRIGTVESWGPPMCRLGPVELPCAELKVHR